MDIRSLMSKLDSIESLTKIREAGDPAEYARAQAQMAKLEKAAQYTGDDEIVRSRMGLPPKLPPIEQWDGKMPQPTGKPDWFAKLGSGFKIDRDEKGSFKGVTSNATGAQDDAIAANKADDERTASQKAFIADLVKQATPLLDKLEQKYSSVKKESFNYTSGIARALAESIGYELTDSAGASSEGNAGGAEAKAAMSAQDPDLKTLAGIMNQLSDIENDATVTPLQDRYAALLNAVEASKKPAQSATPATASPSTQDLTGAASASGEAVGKKLQRFKDLLAKVKEKQSKTKTASAPGAGAAAGGAAGAALGAANPLKNDPITASALPRKDGPVAKEGLSESEIIARLRQQLENIENRGADDEQVDEFIGSAIRGLGALGKAVKTGFTGAPVATGKLTKSGAPQMTSQSSQKFAKAMAARPGLERGAYGLGKAVKANPGKTALATGVAGAGLGYALGGKPGEDPTTTIADTNKKPNQSATPVNPTPATPDEDPDMQELDVLAREFGDSKDPEIAELLKQYSDVKNAQLK